MTQPKRSLLPLAALSVLLGVFGAVGVSRAAQPFRLKSPAFGDGQPIPRQFTGEGKDLSPPLSWEGAPAGTRELALVCDDPDAPSPHPWVHWVIYKIPASVHALKEGIPDPERLQDPPGALQGMNSWPTVGYRGPLPPPGSGWHHYHFTLYALDRPLELPPKADKEHLLEAMKGHVLAQAELVGRYRR